MDIKSKSQVDKTKEDNNRKRSFVEDIGPILVKIDNGSNELVEDIHLYKNEINIGRARNSDVLILNTLISRTHCCLKRTEFNEWMVINKSSTITKLNDKPIPHGESWKIIEGDILQLSESTDFKFKFHLNSKCNHKLKKICSKGIASNNDVQWQKTQFIKQQANEKKDLEDKLAAEKQKQSELQDQLEILLKQQRDSKKDDEKLKLQISSLEDKIELGNTAETELKLKYEQLLAKHEEGKHKFEEQMAEEKRKWEKELESIRKEKESLEADLKEKELEWRHKMDNVVKEEQNVREKLSNEKFELEEKMKKLEEAIKEKEIKSNKDAENIEVYELKNADDINIIDTIDLTHDIVEGVTTQPKPKDNHMFNLVNDIMEEQLTCSICSELFVSAMTLNCTHTFCQYCIHTWMKKRKECPNCRTTIVSMNKSLVLDNFIEKMLENISIEQKQRRLDLIQERSRQNPKSMKVAKKRR